MRVIPIVLLSCLAWVSLGQEDNSGKPSTRFAGPDGTVFFARGATMTVTSGVPFFRAVVDNHSSSGWTDVTVAVDVEAKCPDTEPLRIEFSASLGYLQPGETVVSDAVVSARGVFRSDCKIVGLNFMKFRSGAVESDKAAHARAEQRTHDDANQKRIRAEIDIEIASRTAEIDAELSRAAAAKENCHLIYVATSDIKVSEITVKEEQRVRACQSLGYYN
jgi:hypothetical protein